MFQIVQPNIKPRDPLRPASNNEIHKASFSPIRTRFLSIRMLLIKKTLRKNNRNISVTRISSPANGAKITFETYN